MSKMAKRRCAGLAVLGVFLVVVGYLAFSRSAGTQEPGDVVAPRDVGKFRVGSALGEERAGFSGRAQVLVFTTADAKDWPAISACLESTAVEAEMNFFTGVLVDEVAEPGVERVFRERDGLRVIVRGLGGGFLGCLPAGFACQEFVDLLRAVRLSATSAPEKSPIYVNLLESTAVLDDLIAKGKRSDAAKYVGLLEELEGSLSPAVQAAKAKLGK